MPGDSHRAFFHPVSVLSFQPPPPAQQKRLAGDLAQEAKVSRSFLSQLEKGAFHASLKILEKLAKALEVAAKEARRTEILTDVLTEEMVPKRKLSVESEIISASAQQWSRHSRC